MNSHCVIIRVSKNEICFFLKKRPFEAFGEKAKIENR